MAPTRTCFLGVLFCLHWGGVVWSSEGPSSQYLRDLAPKAIKDMGGYQNYGSWLGRLDARCRIILRTQKGTMMLTTTHMVSGTGNLKYRVLEPFGEGSRELHETCSE